MIMAILVDRNIEAAFDATPTPSSDTLVNGNGPSDSRCHKVSQEKPMNELSLGIFPLFKNFKSNMFQNGFQTTLTVKT